MFNLNSNTDEFKARSKSVFDSLSSLESSHVAKSREYVDKSLDNYDPTREEETGTSSKRDSSSGEFKVPAVPPPSQAKRRRNREEPDHILNPHKWKRYSLDDVKESDMSPAGNYRAAMSFLHRNEANADVIRPTNIEFNRPIGSKRNPKPNSKALATLEEDETKETNEDFKTLEGSGGTEQGGFKKKSSRKMNLRTKKDKDDEDKEESSQAIVDIKSVDKAKLDADEDEFDNQPDVEDETTEFSDRYF